MIYRQIMVVCQVNHIIILTTHKGRVRIGRGLYACDFGGIQTRNLLIRSQMLYSVELRSQYQALISEMRLQRYAVFFKRPNICIVF